MSNRNVPGPLVILAGAAGYSNVGDDAIALAIAGLLKRSVPGVNVVALGGRPEAVTRSTGLEAERLAHDSPHRVSRILRLVGRASLVLIGGGGLLQDRLPHYYRSFLLLAAIAKIMGKPVMLYAVGAYQPRSTTFRLLLRVVGNRIDHITVRDAASREHLLECGVRRPISITVDPAITLAPASDEVVDRILCQDSPSSSVPLIGVSLRPWYHIHHMWPDGSGTALHDMIGTFARALDSVIQLTGADLVLLPMHTRGADNDVPLYRELQGSMERAAHTRLIDEQGPREILGVIRRCDLVVGMRLHSHVFAAAAGVPSVAVAYDPKVRAFMAGLGCGKQVVDLNELSADVLAHRTTETWERRQEIGESLRTKVGALRLAAHETAAEAASLLGGAGAQSMASELLSDAKRS